MKFFDTNVLFNNLGGSNTASSNTAVAQFAFDENNRFSWASDGQGTDGTSITLDRVLAAGATINRIFVKNTNISNLSVLVDVGSGFVTLSSATSFTLIKSSAGDHYYFELDNAITIDSIRITGSNTITANEEKSVGQVLAFNELGQIEYNDDIQPKRTRSQVISKLNTGKVDVINKGRSFGFKIKLKSHYNSSDNTIINTLLQREREVWVWINDNNESIMKMIQEPFRFGDVYKMSFQKNDTMRYTNNAFFSGVDVTFDFIEVS